MSNITALYLGCEKVAAELGKLLGLPIAQTELAIAFCYCGGTKANGCQGLVGEVTASSIC
jgi:hypothetical protein